MLDSIKRIALGLGVMVLLGVWCLGIGLLMHTHPIITITVIVVFFAYCVGSVFYA